MIIKEDLALLGIGLRSRNKIIHFYAIVCYQIYIINSLNVYIVNFYKII
jgi:hypothetical protein